MRYWEEILSCGDTEALDEFPREAVDASSLEVLKARLGGAWRLGCGAPWCSGRCPAGGWKKMIFDISSNPNDSVVL